MQGAVEQRPAGRFAQRGVGGRVDAVDEEIGVVGGLADEGEHRSGPRLDGDHRTLELAERLVGHFLQADVETQTQVRAGDGRGALEQSHHATVRIRLHLLEADASEQGVLVVLLHAELADVLRAAVGGAVYALQIRFADATDVADDVPGELAPGINALQARPDLHAGEAILIDGEARGLGRRQVAAQDLRLEAGAPRAGAVELFDVALAQRHDAAKLVEQRVEVLDLVRGDLEIVDGEVLRQDDAVAVVDVAAHGRDGHQVDAVVARERHVVLMVGHLQMHEPHDKRRDRHHRHQAGDDDA